MALFFVLAFLFLVLAVLIKTNNPRGAKKYLMIVFVILGCFMMFRNSTVGNDTSTYLGYFDAIAYAPSLKAYLASSRLEAGYVLLNKVLSYISKDNQIILIFAGFFTAFSFGRFIYKYSEIPYLSALMFLTFQFFDLSMSAVRQSLAVAILLFAYDYLIDRKPLKFTAIVILATFIHTSSVMCLILYPLSNKNHRKSFYFISLLVSIIVMFSFTSFYPLINAVFPQYMHYFTSTNSEYGFSNTIKLAVVVMLILWICLFLISTTIDDRYVRRLAISNTTVQLDQDYERVFKIATWLSVLMLVLGFRGTILERFKYIYSSAILVYYPNSLNKARGNNRLILVLGSCVVFIAYAAVLYILRPEWQSTYPFSFFWCN